MTGEPWYDLAWQEWVGLGGVVATLVGLWFAWKAADDAKTEAMKASSAAEAAARALSRAEQLLASQRLLIVSPTLIEIRHLIDRAVEREETSLTLEALSMWRTQASGVCGLLNSDVLGGDASKSFAQRVTQSVGLAASAEDALRNRSSDPSASTARARRSIGHVCDELSTWAAQRSSTIHEEVIAQ